MQKIVVAGGCFWGVEHYFNLAKGVIQAKSGYAQSSIENPKYELVKTGTTQAVEAVEIEYDEQIISLTNILELLFRIIDPTSLNKQGEDDGTQYRVGMYYQQVQDANTAHEFVNSIAGNYEHPIVFEIEKLQNFYDAELYHQQYLVKNPTGYCHVNMSKLKPEERK